MALLKLDKLTIRFGGLTAVEGVDCTVDSGQIYSIIGPNGAGKTVVLQALARLFGFDPSLRRMRRTVLIAFCSCDFENRALLFYGQPHPSLINADLALFG